MSNYQTNSISSCKNVVNHLLSELQVKNNLIKNLELQLSIYDKKIELQIQHLNNSWSKDYKKLSKEHCNLEKEYDKLFSYCISMENELEQLDNINSLD
jgi:hypothetical protein